MLWFEAQVSFSASTHDDDAKMSGAAITFDFHDTLVHCPAWFDLEVHHLVSSFLAESLDVRDPALLQSADREYRVLRRRIIQHGHELPAERCVSLVLRKIGVTVDDASISPGVESLMRSTLNSATMVTGADSTVSQLAGEGWRLGVVSSAVYHPFLIWALSQFGIRHQFQSVVTSASAGFYKSRPEIYWTSMNELRAKPGRSLHIGDSFRHDVLGARLAGMRTAWLNPKGETTPMGEDDPDAAIESLTGAAPLLVRALEQARQ